MPGVFLGRKWQRGAVFCIPLLALWLFWRCSPYVCSSKHWAPPAEPALSESRPCSTPLGGDEQTRHDIKTFVVAAVKREDHSWLDEFTPAWEKVVYVMDDPKTLSGAKTPSAPANKGHEAMAYLTYIIDNYKRLPEMMVFLHASRYQWHNEDPAYGMLARLVANGGWELMETDGLRMLQRLQLDHVRNVGYANLRCTWQVGCPPGLQKSRAMTMTESFLMPWNARANADAAFPYAILGLLPELASSQGHSPDVAAPCGSQFAVSARQVHKRSLCHYEHLRNWLLAADLLDSVSGRIFERSWHLIFGMPPVDCRSTEKCFCELYDLCNLTCTEGSCGLYKAPSSLRFPNAWFNRPPGDAMK